MAGMTPEDMQNLASWLQEILKEVQETRNITLDTQQKLPMLQEIRDYVSRERSGGGEIDHKVDELRNRLEPKIDQLEHSLNEIKSLLNDVRSKVH